MRYFARADGIDKSMGGKAIGLARLLSCGVNVPDFVVLPYAVAEEMLGIAGKEQSDSLIRTVSEYEFPEEFTEEVKYIFAKYKFEKVAVRSSCSDEDGEKKSFAGQYKSLSDVTADNLCDAIRRVWLSALDREGRTSYGGEERGKMSVIVQRQIDADRSGVCFSTSPLNKNNILIEYVDGAGESLVSGKKTPMRYEEAKSKTARGFLEIIRSTALALENLYEYAVDLEWCLKDRTVYFVQLRKVTAKYDLPDSSKSKWNLYVKRKFPWLIHSVQVQASKSVEQERLFRFSLPICEGMLIDGSEYYTEHNDEVAESIWASKDIQSIKKFCSDVIDNCRRTCEYTDSLTASSVQITTGKELAAKLREFFSAYINSYIPMMMRPEEYLASELTRRGADEKDMASLGYFDDETMTLGEKKDFLNLAVKYKRGEDIRDAMAEYLARYSWMKSPTGYGFCEYTQKDLIERIAQTSESDCADKLKKISDNSANASKEFDAAIARLSGDTREIALLFNRFVYLRTRTAELSDRLFFVGRKKLFPSIESDGLYLGYDELIDYVEFGKLPANLSERKKGNYTVWNDGVAVTRFGEPPKELHQALDGGVKEHTRYLNGDVACPGKVSGKVRVVSCFADAEQMRKGEILVASMTTTDLTDAIGKAAGFVTDEGGVSCHAAIIARELDVPCIVGAKVATRILRTGMTAQLDAYEGRVTILDDNEDIGGTYAHFHKSQQ